MCIYLYYFCEKLCILCTLECCYFLCINKIRVIKINFKIYSASFKNLKLDNNDVKKDKIFNIYKNYFMRHTKKYFKLNI